MFSASPTRTRLNKLTSRKDLRDVGEALVRATLFRVPLLEGLWPGQVPKTFLVVPKWKHKSWINIFPLIEAELSEDRVNTSWNKEENICTGVLGPRDAATAALHCAAAAQPHGSSGSAVHSWRLQDTKFKKKQWILTVYKLYILKKNYNKGPKIRIFGMKPIKILFSLHNYHPCLLNKEPISLTFKSRH